MLEQLRERAAHAVEGARAAGANEAFVSASRRRSIHFRQRDDTIERVEESTSNGLWLRLYVDGRYSEHSTSDFTPENLDRFISEAVAMTRVLDEDRDRQIPDPALYENRPDDNLDLVDSAIRNLNAAAREEICGQLAAAARRHDNVISATVGTTDSHGMSATVSSNGFSGSREWSQMYLSSQVTLRDEGDRRPDGYFGAAANHLEDLPSADEIGSKSLERAVARIGATQGPTRRTTMIVEPRMAGSILSRLLSPANAEAISQERSFFRGRMGEAMFSERLDVTDNPLIRRGLGSRHYDGEGISARALPLIEAGHARNLYVDTYYGRKTEMLPTTGSSSNIVVQPGEQDLEHLIREAGDGVLITSWLGGNSDPTTGEYSIGIRGHLIEDGEVGQPVGEMNVSGNLLELFSHLTAVGSDPWTYGRYRVPTLVFENVQFSGT